MFRFDPGTPEEEAAQYAEIRANREWMNAYDFLKNYLWHVTSRNGWEAIKKCGAIEPNTDGKFESEFNPERACYSIANGVQIHSPC